MKIVKVNVTLEFETNLKSKEGLENYLHNLNEDIAELPGFPQLVDIEGALRDVRVEDMDDLFEDEEDFLFEEDEGDDENEDF